MSASPELKVYDAEGAYQAACKEPEAAAALLAFYGNGATVRLGHRNVLYTNGPDGDASESYDAVRELMAKRIDELHAAMVERQRLAIERSGRIGSESPEVRS